MRIERGLTLQITPIRRDTEVSKTIDPELVKDFKKSIVLAVNHPPQYFPTTPELKRDFYESAPDLYLTSKVSPLSKELYEKLKNYSLLFPNIMEVFSRSPYKLSSGERFPSSHFPYFFVARDETSLWSYEHKGFSSHYSNNGNKVWQSYLYLFYGNDQFHKQFVKNIFNGKIPVKDFMDTISQRVFNESRRIGPILAESESTFTLLACEYRRDAKQFPHINNNAAVVKKISI